jgi:hypothetical protein
MNLAIIGHGPSLLKTKLGKEIDSHDEVMRIKCSAQLLQHPELFGTKTSSVCGSFTIAPALLKNWRDICKQFFVFLDSRHEETNNAEIRWMRDIFTPEHSCIIDKKLCMEWVKKYQDMRIPTKLNHAQEKKKTQTGKELSDNLGHKHCSAGMFAIIHAMEYICPDKVTLYGFDNIANGAFDWSLTRGEGWLHYPDHSWATEHLMLFEVAKTYGYDVDIPKQRGLNPYIVTMNKT